MSISTKSIIGLTAKGYSCLVDCFFAIKLKQGKLNWALYCFDTCNKVMLDLDKKGRLLNLKTNAHR